MASEIERCRGIMGDSKNYTGSCWLTLTIASTPALTAAGSTPHAAITSTRSSGILWGSFGAESCPVLAPGWTGFVRSSTRVVGANSRACPGFERNCPQVCGIWLMFVSPLISIGCVSIPAASNNYRALGSCDVGGYARSLGSKLNRPNENVEVPFIDLPVHLVARWLAFRIIVTSIG